MLEICSRHPVHRREQIKHLAFHPVSVDQPGSGVFADVHRERVHRVVPVALRVPHSVFDTPVSLLFGVGSTVRCFMPADDGVASKRFRNVAGPAPISFRRELDGCRNVNHALLFGPFPA